METVTKKGRVLLNDELRGIMIISMLIYHICYDLAAVVGLPGMGWFYSPAADFWQLSICGVFIFIAGACCRYSKSNLKRGLRLFLLGMLFTVVTALFVPNLLIVFGLLHFLGVAVPVSYTHLMGVYPEALSYFGYKTREGELLTASATPKKTANIMFGSESAYEFEDTKRSWRNNRISAVPDEKGNLPDPFVNPMKDKIVMKLESQEQDEKGNPKYPTITRDVHVTGVLESNPSLGWETSYYCFMDIRELQQLYKEYKRVNKIKTDPNNSYSGNDGLENYTQVKVKVSDIDAVSSVDEAIKAMGFETYSLESVREPMQKQMQQQQLFLGSLAAISLLVAAIGITNTMIMSIYERTREIGVMKVLGCKVANIREVFLMEAGLIGFCGGLAGVGVSLAISKLLNYLATNGSLSGENGNFLSGLMGGIGSMAMGSELSIIPGWLMISAIVFATIIGLVSGFYPANRAVKISALEAIKHE